MTYASAAKRDQDSISGCDKFSLHAVLHLLHDSRPLLVSLKSHMKLSIPADLVVRTSGRTLRSGTPLDMRSIKAVAQARSDYIPGQTVSTQKESIHWLCNAKQYNCRTSVRNLVGSFPAINLTPLLSATQKKRRTVRLSCLAKTKCIRMSSRVLVCVEDLCRRQHPCSRNRSGIRLFINPTSVVRDD